jgi:hypothetical protein
VPRQALGRGVSTPRGAERQLGGVEGLGVHRLVAVAGLDRPNEVRAEWHEVPDGHRAALGGDFPAAALATVGLVADVLGNVVGDSSVGSTNQFESSQAVDGGKTNLSALMVSSTTISKKDWKISQDFSISAYLLVVFPKPSG